ncbi:MAG: GHMP kinase [Candidatus Lokiarchaeota archaeon]|nr:GHMP kinase [Candidatus Lokiarchaeota archaeon]
MIRIRAPGRINLFGEHQDYLDYPIIAMAISKYIYLEAKKTSSSYLSIELSDLNEDFEIKLNNKELEYFSKRDYLRSAYNQYLRKGFRFQKGYKIKITGDIPINAGAASSSALVIAWLFFLNLISRNRQKMNKFQLSLMGYDTEVEEFNEGGGMMDHFTSVYGGLIYLEPKKNEPEVINKNIKLDGFVLGNSLEKKETVEDLFRVKDITKKAFMEIKKIMPKFNQYLSSLEEVKKFLPNLKKKYQKKIIGNIINRDITIQAKKLIFNSYFDKKFKDYKFKNNFYINLGNLLNEHHYQLKENIEVSTDKIEKMVSNCLELGALGAKINGSGFGGTMFAFFPNNEDLLVESIEKMGGKAFKIKTSNGVEIY